MRSKTTILFFFFFKQTMKLERKKILTTSSSLRKKNLSQLNTTENFNTDRQPHLLSATTLIFPHLQSYSSLFFSSALFPQLESTTRRAVQGSGSAVPLRVLFLYQEKLCFECVSVSVCPCTRYTVC